MFSHCLHCACGRQLTLSNFSVRALPFPCAEFEPDVAAEILPVILQQPGINRAALIRAAARRALIDEAAAKQLLLVLAKGAHGAERGFREWKKRRYEGASGAPRLHFSWVNALASSEKNSADAEPRPTPSPRNPKFATKRARIWAFLLEPSTELCLRALCASIQARKTRLLISDVFASLFGISHPCGLGLLGCLTGEGPHACALPGGRAGR